jgi:integrase
MATVRRRPRSRFWHGCYRDAAGKMVQRSTKTKDKAVALRIAMQWEAAAQGKKTIQQLRKVMGEIADDMSESQSRATGVTIGKLADAWLARKEKECAPSTHLRYTGIFSRFMAHVGRDTHPDDVGPEAISLWHEAEAGRTSATSANTALKVVRSFLKDQYYMDRIARNPAERIQAMRVRNAPTRRPFTLDEIKVVLAVTKGEWKTLVLLGLYTGQRLGDLLALQWSQIEAQTWVMKITTQKTRTKVVLPLPPPLVAQLRKTAHSKRTGPVMPDLNSRPITTVSRQFGEILSKAKLTPPTHHKKARDGRDRTRARTELTFHSLRHTCTTLLKLGGAPQAIAMAIVGHRSESISDHYTHVDAEAMRKATSSMPDVT